MSQSRRAFIKTGTLLSVGLPFIQACDFFNGQSPSSDNLFTLFQNPPVTAKPFVRWWWNGNRLSEKEILRQLDVIKNGGIGGVEINSIAFPGDADPMGIQPLQWLSHEWIDMVKVALKGAEERGMICDIIVGSGWPFGGEFLKGDEQTQLLTLTSRKVKGKRKIKLNVSELLEEAAPHVASGYKGSVSELHSVWLAPLQMNSFKPGTKLPFEITNNSISLDIPEGEHILYAMVKITGFMAVINGAPGASGPVLNHFNQDAVEKFLNRMSDNLFPQLEGLKGFRALFCDSMELEGANWCRDFTDEFKRRKGYDIEPYLPFILYKVGHMGHAIEGGETTQLSGAAQEEIERVRHDFFVACMEIMEDRFLEPYTQWCRKHNTKSRMQAYGREFHPLETSMKIDIPECETWLWHGDDNKDVDFVKSPTYTNVNKFVASAARLTGKKVVSCEEITNTGVVFNATLDRIKITGDQSNLSGVTHSILHGFNYSPQEAKFPGWIRYGTFFSDRNTWWPWFKLWSAYKARLSVVLQESRSFADIAVIHPLADMWTKFGPQRDPFPGLHYPTYQYRVWESIHQNGNSCDYLSENILQKGISEKGHFTYNHIKYHTIILLAVESMMPATAEALASFAKNGGKIIFVEKEPYKSPGLKDHKENDEKVKQTIATMKKDHPKQIFSVEAPGEDMVQWFKAIQQKCNIKPYMEIDQPNPYLSQIRHQADDKEIYFITNCSMDKKISVRAKFTETKGKPWIWDTETGERYLYPNQSGQTLSIDLEPSSSRLIVFDNYKGTDTRPVDPSESSDPIELSGWSVRMLHINGNKSEVELPVLKDWSTDEATRGFAGELVYENKIGKSITGYNYIDLGKVYGVSEISLNGESLGCKWYGRHIYRIPEQLMKSENLVLQVKITTTTGNYLKSSTDNKTGQDWTNWQGWMPMGMLGPVRIL